MINWTTITNRLDYENQRYNFLLKTEERGTPKLIPYNDNENLLAAGNITIGVGFNLEGSTAVRDEVFRTFGLVRNNPVLSTTPPAPGQLSAQQVENDYIDQLIATIGTATTSTDLAELNTIMATRAADTRLSALGTRRSTFAFTDEPEIRATFDRLMTNIYEPKVDNWLSGIPDSRERTALISLAWNQKDSSPLLGNKLKAAVVNGDRAEAWYEIRYNSNSASQPANIRNGIAKRRYFEADTFGLYNNAAANNDEDAKGAFRTYTRHRTAIDSYESQFGAQVALANSDYNTTIVQTLPAWHQPARVYLTAQYGQSISITGDIQVGEDATTLYYKNTDADVLNGTAQSDLIFGESGNDILNGYANPDVLYGGSGQDFMIGGVDNDYLDGGTGNDLYFHYAGDGTDTIVDADGLGKIVYVDTAGEHIELTGGTRPAGATDPYTSVDNRFTYALNGTTLSVTADGATVLTLNNYTPSALGLTLTDLTQNRQTGSVTGTPDADYVTAGDAVQLVTADAGNDIVRGAPSDNQGSPGLVGGAGHDWLNGNAGHDWLEGGEGNDFLSGGPGYDQLYGGAGNDLLVVYATSGATEAVPVFDPDGPGPQPGGLSEADWRGYLQDWNWTTGFLMDQPSGRIETTLNFAFAGPQTPTDPNAVRTVDYQSYNLPTPDTQDDSLYGGAGDDTLFGYLGNDELSGEDGDDHLIGAEGEDALYGGAGDDWITGSLGHDFIAGGPDTLTAGTDNDELYGEEGNDLIFGGAGDDYIEGDFRNPNHTLDRHGNDTIYGGTGNDTVFGEGGDDYLDGGDGADQLVGEAGSDMPPELLKLARKTQPAYRLTS